MNLPLLYITLKSNSLWGRLYIIFFSCGFICWCLDQLACFYLQELQLHAWWHIFTSLALVFALLELLKLNNSKLTILVDDLSENLYLASRNIPNVFVLEARYASTYDILDCEILLMDKASVETINSILDI